VVVVAVARIGNERAKERERDRPTLRIITEEREREKGESELRYNGKAFII